MDGMNIGLLRLAQIFGRDPNSYKVRGTDKQHVRQSKKAASHALLAKIPMSPTCRTGNEVSEDGNIDSTGQGHIGSTKLFQEECLSSIRPATPTRKIPVSKGVRRIDTESETPYLTGPSRQEWLVEEDSIALERTYIEAGPSELSNHQSLSPSSTKMKHKQLFQVRWDPLISVMLIPHKSESPTPGEMLYTRPTEKTLTSKLRKSVPTPINEAHEVHCTRPAKPVLDESISLYNGQVRTKSKGTSVKCVQWSPMIEVYIIPSI
jgi:hypothetical protein